MPSSDATKTLPAYLLLTQASIVAYGTPSLDAL